MVYRFSSTINITVLRVTTVAQSLDLLLKGQFSYLNQYYKIYISSSNQSNILEKVGNRESVLIEPTELCRKISPIKDLISLLKMVRLIKKIEPIIVHTHTPKAGFIGMLAAFLSKVPIRLHTVAGLPLLESTGLKRKVLDFIEKLTYFCAHKVYPNSNGLNKIIINNGYCNTDKLKVIANGSSNGIDTSYFSSKATNEPQVADVKEKFQIKNTK